MHPIQRSNRSLQPIEHDRTAIFLVHGSQATISTAQLGKSAAGLAKPSPLKTLEEGVPRAVALAKLEQARHTNPSSRRGRGGGARAGSAPT